MNLIHKVRKGLAAILATSVVAMTLVVSPSAQAASFADVPADAWFAPYVNALTEAGVFAANTNFRPADNMNRAEFVKTLVVAAGVSIEGAANAGFSDVTSSDWFAPYVNAAVAKGIINGSDKSATFRPTDNVTRAEAVKIALNAFGIDTTKYSTPKAAFSDDDGHWAEDLISAAYNLSIVDGQGGSKTVFAPNEAISRSAVAKIATYAVIVAEDAESYVRFDDGSSAFSVFESSEIVSQVAALIKPATTTPGTTTPGTETTTPTTETPVTSDGTLEVSLSADSPTSATLPGGVTGVTVAKFDVTANGDDVNLSSLVLRRGGLGTDGVVSSVVVFDETGRVAKSKTINNTTDEATITFLGGGVAIKAGETKTLSVVAALASSATTGMSGSEFDIELVSASSVVSNAQEVVGDFPVKGNLMKLGSTDGAALLVQTDGDITAPKLGQTGVEVAKLKLKNNDSNNSISVSSITLKEDGTIDEASELKNFDLYIEGEKVASTASAQNKYVTFNLATPYTLKSSKTVKASVKADVVGGANDTIQFILDSVLDISATDLKTGFGAAVSNSSYSPAAVTVDAGEITLTTVDAANTDILKDKKDIVAGTIKLAAKSGKDLELQKVAVTLTATGTSAVTAEGDTIGELVENVELYDVKTGTVYDLTSPSTDTDDNVDNATDTAVFSDTSLTIPVTGDKEFQVRFDTKNVASVANVNFTFSIDTINGNSALNTPVAGLAASQFYLVETGNDRAVTDITPSSITFKKLKGTSSSATLSVITQSATKNAVIGTKDVEALQFQVKAGSASALDLDEVKIGGTVVDNGGSDTLISNKRVNKATLYKVEGTTKTALDTVSGSQFNTSGVATFDGFKVNIAANNTATFLVTLDVIDDQNQALDTINVTLTSLSLSDKDSDDLTAITYGSSTPVPSSLTVASTRTITIRGVGTLAIAADTTDSATDKAKYVLGNTTSDFVASYELTATNEGIMIQDLRMLAAGVTEANFKAAVSEIVLYKEDKTTEIARKSVTSRTIDFTDINYTVAEGSENIYVKVVANKQGKDQSGAIVSGMQFSMQVTDADGSSSNKQIDGTGGSVVATTNPVESTSGFAGNLNLTTVGDATTDADILDTYEAAGFSYAFSTIPTRISAVEFVDSFGGQSVASKLSNGQNTVAILKVTTDSSSNTDATDGTSLKTVLSTLKFAVESDACEIDTDTAVAGCTGGNLLTADASTGFTVEKINGTGDYTTNVVVASSTGTVNLVDGVGTTGIDATNVEIDNGTSVYYVIKATVAGLTDSTQKYVQVKINGLDSGDIAYASDDTGVGSLEASASARAALLIPNLTKIEAKKVSQ